MTAEGRYCMLFGWRMMYLPPPPRRRRAKIDNSPARAVRDTGNLPVHPLAADYREHQKVTTALRSDEGKK